MRFVAVCLLPCALAACGSEDAPAPEPSTIALEDVRVHQGTAEPSPDTSRARWRVSADGQGIDFGNDGANPWLTLTCDLRAAEPLLVIVRHAEAFPGQSALFPFIGNGMRSRFMADAVLNEGEWRWEAQLDADDPQLDVFAGTRDFTATLPGHGLLEVRGSRMPGEFLAWCRSGGETQKVRQDPAPEPSATPAT